MKKNSGKPRASKADRAYFARIARGNRAIVDERPPNSLDEMLDRLERIRRDLGAMARPGITADGDGDLASHLAFLERQHRIDGHGTHSA
jgi:hypothetical protein